MCYTTFRSFRQCHEIIFEYWFTPLFCVSDEKNQKRPNVDQKHRCWRFICMIIVRSSWKKYDFFQNPKPLEVVQEIPQALFFGSTYYEDIVITISRDCWERPKTANSDVFENHLILKSQLLHAKSIKWITHAKPGKNFLFVTWPDENRPKKRQNDLHNPV